MSLFSFTYYKKFIQTVDEVGYTDTLITNVTSDSVVRCMILTGTFKKSCIGMQYIKSVHQSDCKV